VVASMGCGDAARFVNRFFGCDNEIVHFVSKNDGKD